MLKAMIMDINDALVMAGVKATEARRDSSAGGMLGNIFQNV